MYDDWSGARYVVLQLLILHFCIVKDVRHLICGSLARHFERYLDENSLIIRNVLKMSPSHKDSPCLSLIRILLSCFGS